ncbi:MAG: MFS transporter, partial [Desulfobulbia bacterium]
GRSITGFTAGNQPIAQAAMVDGSIDEADRDRNMGYIITGISFGLVGGPIMGGFLSDKDFLGSYATLDLPFYGALVLATIALIMVLIFFKDIRTDREPFVFKPFIIFNLLARVRNYPKVLDLMPAYIFFMIANVTFYVFLDNYLTSAFGYGTLGGSMAMLTIGIALAVSSTFLVAPAQERFSKRFIVGASMITWIVGSLSFVFLPIAWLCFIPIFMCYFIFGVAYPTMLGLFSASVPEAEQGWVMGITTAVFCLAAGIMSLIGGWLMSIDIALPYYIATVAGALGFISVLIGWTRPPLSQLVSSTE